MLQWVGSGEVDGGEKITNFGSELGRGARCLRVVCGLISGTCVDACGYSCGLISGTCAAISWMGLRVACGLIAGTSAGISWMGLRVLAWVVYGDMSVVLREQVRVQRA